MEAHIHPGCGYVHEIACCGAHVCCWLPTACFLRWHVHDGMCMTCPKLLKVAHELLRPLPTSYRFQFIIHACPSLRPPLHSNAFHRSSEHLQHVAHYLCPAGDGRGDGWQLLGFTQHHPDTHTPLWLHRTMNKWAAPHSQDPVGGTELPWPVHLLTGPLPKE